MDDPGVDVGSYISRLADQGAVALAADGKTPVPMSFGLKVNGAVVSDLTHEFVVSPDFPASAPTERAK